MKKTVFPLDNLSLSVVLKQLDRLTNGRMYDWWSYHIYWAAHLFLFIWCMKVVRRLLDSPVRKKQCEV